ncbi:DUF3887 domain-containing protein [Synechococcus sp. RSCCF101]|uniref:DUF3887 domain-containing protein n=1 Tax=Synechococcus sp. RSCCF101 TaxID=2511069 RepID=UPI001245C75B|nr:DUF3887 domain-containing protein [Synechococcus sp. RSCCF101]QEY31412.1 DUF3887 domain-containing protein [Synechococcus sp. RSCCF101]
MLRALLATAVLGLPPLLTAPLAEAAPITELSTSPQQVLAAASTLLKAVQIGDAQAVYDALAPSVQQGTSPERVQARLGERGAIRSTRITHLHSGVDDSTVEAVLVDENGSHPLTMVLDGGGKLLAWEWHGEESSLERSAIGFVEDVSAGRWLRARERMVLSLQEDLPPESMQEQWNGLQESTGPFEGVRGAVVASEGGDQQLVLVTTDFGRLTDNIFVIFDRQGRISGVDFPVVEP